MNNNPISLNVVNYTFDFLTLYKEISLKLLVTAQLIIKNENSEYLCFFHLWYVSLF